MGEMYLREGGRNVDVGFDLDCTKEQVGRVMSAIFTGRFQLCKDIYDESVPVTVEEPGCFVNASLICSPMPRVEVDLPPVRSGSGQSFRMSAFTVSRGSRG